MSRNGPENWNKSFTHFEHRTGGYWSVWPRWFLKIYFLLSGFQSLLLSDDGDGNEGRALGIKAPLKGGEGVWIRVSSR